MRASDMCYGRWRERECERKRKGKKKEKRQKQMAKTTKARLMELIDGDVLVGDG